MSKELLQGTVAMAEAAVMAGCRFFAGYPITPQNEIPEWMSVRMPEVGGVFIQAESEIAAVNMLYGASSTGIRCMTSSSGLGFALKSEGIGGLSAGRLPSVLINVVRGGPSMGNVRPSQADYFSAVKSPCPGGSHTFVVAPHTVQEAVNLVYEAFDIADRYRTPVTVLTDAMVGNVIEAVEMPAMRDISSLPDKSDWKVTMRNKPAREGGALRSIVMGSRDTPELLMQHNIELAEMYAGWEKDEQRHEEFMMDGAEYVITAYGSSARIAKSAVKALRAEGILVGLLRPITLFPFPTYGYKQLAGRSIKKVFVAEMAIPPQFYEDVRLATECAQELVPIVKAGGVVIKTADIVESVKSAIGR